MKTLSRSPFFLRTAGLVALMCLTATRAHAVSATWNASPTNGNWEAAGAENNWSTGAATFPGDTSGATTNQDTATFLTSSVTSIVLNLAPLNLRNITFGAVASPSAFTIGTTGGNALLLSSAGSISITSGSTVAGATETINAPIVLEPLTGTTAGTYSFSNASGLAGSILSIGGTVTGGTTTSNITLTLTGSNGSANTVGGIISDGGAAGGMAISKTSTGLWILSGANTYTGGTTLTQGTLSVGTTGNLGGASSALIFNGGTLQITGTALTSISGIGHAVTFNPGTLVGLDINSAANTFTVDQVLNQTTGGLTKAGAGTLVLNQANTYSGLTTLSLGTLQLAGTNSSAGATTVSAGTLQLNNTTANNGGLASGTLTLGGGILQSLVANLAISNNVVITGNTVVSGANSLTINGSVTNSGGNRVLTSSITGGNILTLAGNVFLSEAVATSRTFQFGGTGITLISGVIANANGAGAGVGTLNFNGTGATTLSGANTYSGGTIIGSSSGAIGAPLNVATIGNVGGASSNLGTAGVLTIGSALLNGQLVYTGVGEDTDRVVNLGGTAAGTGGNAIITQSGTGLLRFTSNFTSTGAGTKTLTLQGSTAGRGEISGAIVDNLTGTNNTAVTKAGTGTWTLSGANTYSGATTVTAGTLLDNGTHTGGGAYSITGTGKYGGAGNITAPSLTMAAGTKLTPGGDGVLGNLTLNLSGTMNIAASSNNTGAYIFDLATPATSDKVTLATGTLSIGIVDFADFTFNPVAGFGAGTYTLFDANSAITGSLGTASGTINGMGATLSFDNLNNDLLLTVVPEPSTWAMLVSGCGVLMGLQCFRRRSGASKRSI